MEKNIGWVISVGAPHHLHPCLSESQIQPQTDNQTCHLPCHFASEHKIQNFASPVPRKSPFSLTCLTRRATGTCLWALLSVQWKKGAQPFPQESEMLWGSFFVIEQACMGSWFPAAWLSHFLPWLGGDPCSAWSGMGNWRVYKQLRHPFGMRGSLTASPSVFGGLWISPQYTTRS